MKYLVIDIWEPLDVAQAKIKSLYNEKFDKVILFTPHEWTYWEPSYYQELQQACIDTDHLLTILANYKEIYIDTNLRCKHEIIQWDTHYINRTYANLVPSKNTPNIIYNDYRYHFISMNWFPRQWRCLLMDLVVKNNLHKKNAISWHKPEFKYYTWKYWKPRMLKFEGEEEFSKTRNYNFLPKAYYNSFAQLVSETSQDTLFISEKTATALLMSKPFLVASVPKFHRYLDELGFKRYDEIFDYSFDLIDDVEQRFETLLQNFVRLSTIDYQDLYSLADKIKSKLEFNRKRAIEIAMDYSIWPDLAKEMINHMKTTDEKISFRLWGVYETIYLNERTK